MRKRRQRKEKRRGEVGGMNRVIKKKKEREINFI